MRFSLLPREARFFDLFEQLASYVLTGAQRFLQMLQDMAHIGQAIKQIKEVEHEADLVVQKIVKGVDRAFVTPWEREDIHALASALDNVLDSIEALAYRFWAYRIHECTPPAVAAARAIERACRYIDEAVKLARTLNDMDSFHAALAEVDRIEHDVDELSREAIRQLFLNGHGTDVLQVITWKELYERLEGTTDRCQDVANTLLEISIKNA